MSLIEGVSAQRSSGNESRRIIYEQFDTSGIFFFGASVGDLGVRSGRSK